MKKFLFLIVWALISVFPPLLIAATYNAANCTQAAVSTAVGLSSNGDTVTIPACSGGTAWTTGLEITKNITLQGNGIGSTVLLDSTTSGPMLTMSGSGTWRVTGIEFRGGASSKSWSYLMLVNGSSKAFRIDNCKFYNWIMGGGNRAIWLSGDLWGVIDSNTFDANNEWTQAIQVQHPTWGGVGDYGDNSFADDDYLGTNKFVFIESNTFQNSTAVPYPGSIDSLNGARVVVRHNTFNNEYVVSHGTESGQRSRGLRVFEVYNNTFNNTGGAWFTSVYIRSGTGVIYNNTINNSSGSETTRAALFANYRSSGSYTPWGQCNGSNSYDQNAGSPSGYACIDQPGRGKGDLMSGATPSPVAWPNQALSPIYIWGNTGYSQAQAASDSAHVVLDRDYYVGTVKSGYAAYTFPHPLRGEGGPDTTPPVRSSLSPSGAQECDAESPVDIVLSLTTDEPATCKGSPTNEAYADLDWTFDGTGTTSHSKTLSLACDATYTYYVRCQDDESTPNSNDDSTPASVEINFTINPATTDTTKPTWTSSTLSADGRTLSLVFSEAVKRGASYADTQVTVTPTGGAATLNYVSGDNSNTLVFNTSRVILSSATETLTTTITQPGNGIEDQAGNDLDAVAGKSTTNNSTQVPDVPSVAGQIKLWDDSVDTTGDGVWDGLGIEVGVKFQSSVVGVITGIRFYKRLANTGTHVGNIWTVTGTNLGTVNFSGETESGWQTQSFASPIHIVADTQYVASVFMPSGLYQQTNNYFAVTGVTSGVLSAPQSTAGNANGVFYHPTSVSAYPRYDSIYHQNFWVDVVFEKRSSATTIGGPHSLTIGGGTSSLTW